MQNITNLSNDIIDDVFGLLDNFEIGSEIGLGRLSLCSLSSQHLLELIVVFGDLLESWLGTAK